MVYIGTRPVSPVQPCFFIAEAGINHNGSLDMALRLVEEAKRAGAEAVKFQKRTVSIVYSKEELAQPRQFDRSFIDHALARRVIEGVEYEVLPPENLARINSEGPTTNGDLKYALEFGPKEYDIINRHCLDLGIVWSASPWDGLSANFVNGYDDVKFMKIASACLTNRDLLERVRAKGKPVILSTGGSTIEQVQEAVRILGTDNLVLLHCVATYPLADSDTNLLVIETLRRMYPQVPVGYSSHSTDIFPPLMAAAMGACIIEAHLTISKALPGSDQKASLEPAEFADLVKQVRRLEGLRGDSVKRVSPGEVAVMKKLRRETDF